MRLRDRFSRLGNLGFLIAVLLGIFWACQVNQVDGHTYLSIDADTSLTQYDQLVVVVKDTATGAQDTVFNKHLAAVDELKKIPLENYHGQKVSITLTGFRDGKAAYQEVRQYDGQNPDGTKVTVILSDVTVESAKISPHTLTLKKGGDAHEISAAILPAKASQAMAWSSANVDVATVQPKAGDETHALVTPGAVGQTSIVVASQKDLSKTDTLTVFVVDSAVQTYNANLSALTVSAGALDNPAFSPLVRVSGAVVANSVTSTTVTATAADTSARIIINGAQVASGTESAPIPLSVGVDSIYIIVTAQDASQKSYVIALTRAAPNSSSNANLSALAISAGALDAPAFSAAGRVSGTAVANSVASTTVTATVADTTARLTINGVATASGAASAAIPLAVGVDSIFIVVTAQDATTKTYVIGLTRAKSSNANLSALTVSAGALNNPAFDPSKRVSGMTVANSRASTTVTATLADTSARLTIGAAPTGGTAVVSGTPSAPLALAVGVDSIFIVVTAQDGAKNTYVVGITRSASSDAALATLTPTPGSLSPVFAAGTTAYTVNYTTDSMISVKATPAQTGSAMTWNGTALTAGAASAAIKVGYGSTPFNLVVTAPDAVTKTTYVVTVVRVDNVPPSMPVVNPMAAKVYLLSPRWSWSSGGNGGSATFRFKFDDADLTSGSTTITGSSMTPALSDGPHTLYVQERDAAGNWSPSGSASTFVMFGPASWYKFDNGDYADHGFNKNNGTAGPTIALVASPGGVANGAVHFNGGSSLINLGVPKYPTTNDSITLSCWIMTDLNSNGYAFWGQLSLSGVTNPDEVVGSVSDGTARRIDEYTILGQTWVHVALTFDGKQMALYVNGESDPGIAEFVGSPTLIGASFIGSDGDRFWNGSIDDVRIYNRVLSSAEISALSSNPP
jgi:hypothetical protein